MEIKYEGEQGKSYLVVEDENIDYDSYQIHMMINNRIHGVLNASVRTINLRQKIYYDITSKLSLKQILDIRKLTANDIITMINELTGIVDEVKNYLLSEEDCMLSPQYLYFQTDTLTPYVCIYPSKEMSNGFNDLISTFMEELSENNRDDDEKLAYCLYRFAKLKGKTIIDLKSSLDSYLVDQNKKDFKTERNVPFENYVAEHGREFCVDKRNSYVDKDFYTDEKPVINSRKFYDTNMRHENLNTNKAQEIKDVGINQEGLDLDTYNDKTNIFGIDFINTFKDNLLKNRNALNYGIIGISIVIIVLVNLLFLRNSQGNYNIKLSFILNVILLLVMFVALYIINKTSNFSDVEANENVDLEFIPIFDFIDHTKPEGKAVKSEPCYTQFIEVPPKESKQPTLINIESGEKYIINIEPFIIGKIEGTVNMKLDSPTVSRLHAQISIRGDHIYIQDLNSKNGTFIDGKRLEPSEEHRLTHKEIISIADITLEYNN